MGQQILQGKIGEGEYIHGKIPFFYMIIRGDTITYFSENSHLFAGQIFLGFIFPLALYNDTDAASDAVRCKSALRHCHVIVIFLLNYNLRLFILTGKPMMDKPIMDTLIAELKVKIIEILNLQDLTPETFDENAPLIGGSLGIDSIDVLEMVVMVEKDYGVVINSQEVGEKIFASLVSLAEYIMENRPGTAV
jgi:acyl carrier protein